MSQSTLEIDGKLYTVAAPVADLFLAISEERDLLKRLAQDLVCARIEHLSAAKYYAAMDPICERAHRLLDLTRDD